MKVFSVSQRQATVIAKDWERTIGTNNINRAVSIAWEDGTLVITTEDGEILRFEWNRH